MWPLEKMRTVLKNRISPAALSRNLKPFAPGMLSLICREKGIQGGGTGGGPKGGGGGGKFRRHGQVLHVTPGISRYR